MDSEVNFCSALILAIAKINSCTNFFSLFQWTASLRQCYDGLQFVFELNYTLSIATTSLAGYLVQCTYIIHNFVVNLFVHFA